MPPPLPTVSASNVTAAPFSVVFVTEAQFTAGLNTIPQLASLYSNDAQITLLNTLAKAHNFSGKFKTCLLAPVFADSSESPARVLLVGLGNIVDGVSSATAFLTVEKLRHVIFTVVNQLKTAKVTDATIFLPSAAIPVSIDDAVPIGAGEGYKPRKAAAAAEEKSEKTVSTAVPKNPASMDEIVATAVRQAVLSNHTFDKYWKEETAKERNHQIGAFQFAVAAGADVNSATAAANNAAAVAESVILARELGNDRSDVVNPQFLEDIARKLVGTHSDVMKIRVLDEAELLRQGFNLITAVGQAATVPPRIVAIEYDTVNDDNVDWTGYVGKGVTFDTGGLNLKPTGFMEEMHMDMCGSAAVLGAFRAFGVTRPKAKIVGVLALCENAIDAKSYKPHAIIDTYQGSVQIGNTDAEGRLALADALTFIQNEYKPSHVVDLATLTGACVVALGEYAAGLFSNSTCFAGKLTTAGQTHYERLWRLPILPEHIDEMKGDQSDLSSTGKGRYGGASCAAAFLEKYIQAGVSWGHIDLAGPAMYNAPRGYTPKGATGFGVQTLVEYAVNKK